MSGMRDSYRPNFGSGRPPPVMPDSVREAMFSFDGVRKPNRGYGREVKGNNRRGGYGRNPRPPRTTSSRPLLRQRGGVDEQIFRDTSVADKFRNVDELTDSEEDVMSESTNDDEDGHRTKKAKTTHADSPAAANPPKWSNPDPYTALPPAFENAGKRTDVLKLIRKAKITDEGAKKNTAADSEDFIAFGDDSEDEEENEILAAAPNGPRTHRRTASDLSMDGAADDPAGENLGKRKRGHQAAIPRPPGGYLPDRFILPQWLAPKNSDATPWFRPRNYQDSAGLALHKEVIDFFDWVKPQEYEREVRADVLKRLSLAFNRIEPGELKAFGSYAAGLYLPVGDMDLVYLTRQFNPKLVAKNGLPPKPGRRLLERFAALLRNRGIAKPGSILLIAHAKVPIVKFVDARSGVRVDLSFNNDSGLIANETVQGWKVLYPAMPVIVAIIKQFLMIRGLNDVASGGLGGFSIICLVTSFIQHLPKSGSTANLGQMLVEFFNLYANIHDRETVAIRLDPPGYIDKVAYKPLLYSNDKPDRLTIIDPNRPENNISGGSHLIGKIVDAFAQAYETLQARMADYEDGADSISFLTDLVGGNFSAYNAQRRLLGDVYFGLTGQEAPRATVVSAIRETRAVRAASAKPTRTNPAMESSITSSTRVSYETANLMTGVAPPSQPESNLDEKALAEVERVEINLPENMTSVVSDGAAQPTKPQGPDLSKVPIKAKVPVKTSGKWAKEPEKQFSKGMSRAILFKTARPELKSKVGQSLGELAAIKLGGYKDRHALIADLDKHLPEGKTRIKSLDKRKKKPKKPKKHGEGTC